MDRYPCHSSGSGVLKGRTKRTQQIPRVVTGNISVISPHLPGRSWARRTKPSAHEQGLAGVDSPGGGMITLYRRTGVSLLANWLRALLCHSTSELPESNSSLQSSLTSQFRL